MIASEITIFTVPGPNHSPSIIKTGINGGWRYALKNIEFISKLNPALNITVVFGHVEEFGEIPPLPQLININYHVVKTEISKLNLKYPKNPSSQHGSILNYVFKTFDLRTRFFAVIDPDCYLLQIDGLINSINYMESRGLACIGASYPSNWDKAYYWDFPTAYFQLMDSNLLSPSKLDFYPDESTYVALQQDPSKTVLPLSWVSRFILKLPNKLARFVYKVLWKISHANNSFSLFIKHWHLNYPFKNANLFRDTGWSNRELFSKLKSEVMPHAISAVHMKYKFNVESYLKSNPDVAEAKIDARWHFLTNGIHENRSIGSQRVVFRLLHKFFRNKVVDWSVHPATSIVMVDKLVFSELDPIANWGSMEFGFEYHWRGNPYCIHLGHGGKQDPDEDMLRLERLLNFAKRKS